MPKIAADNIEEHIRQQTERLLDAAGEHFTRDGYRGTDLGNIAETIGLARNSLYRYFPGKDHILVAVVEREVMPFVERASSLTDKFPDPAARIDAWLDLHLELATRPYHSMIRMLGDMSEAPEDLRERVRLMHLPPRKVLEVAIADLLDGTGRNPAVVSAMVESMMQAAGSLAKGPRDADAIASELKTSVRSILADGD